MTFEAKRAIVTGAASGIGAATVRLLQTRGAQVVAVDVAADALATIAAETGAIAHIADLADAAAVEGMVRFAAERLGGLDILVNNAGIGALAKATDLDPVVWRRVMAIDLDAVFFAARLALPHLVESGGCIVNTASISGTAADYGFAAYNTAKAGLIGLTRNLAIDYAAAGVRVNAVSPGFTATPMTTVMPQPVSDMFVSRIPMRRAGTPEEMARAILFLAGDDASYITGHNLIVDGGITAHTGQPDLIGLASGASR